MSNGKDTSLSGDRRNPSNVNPAIDTGGHNNYVITVVNLSTTCVNMMLNVNKRVRCIDYFHIFAEK